MTSVDKRKLPPPQVGGNYCPKIKMVISQVIYIELHWTSKVI
jgi:hypothetical protein